MPRWSLINQSLKLGLAEPIETYSSSDHLFESMNIPAGSTGRLVKAKLAEATSRTSSREITRKHVPKLATAPKAKTERTRIRNKKFIKD